MSLTNPNTPVSQQDLQDFYHKILPYMGGSFGMIANKFSKGDLYSTEEKMIGQWIDGKPLYQRTYNFGTLPNQSIKTLPSGLSNVAVYRMFGTAVNATGFTIPLPNVETDDAVSKGNVHLNYLPTNDIRIRTDADFSTFNGVVTLRYTKNTDTAISIGSDTDYSTEEKIVGTWIDESPVYQRTLQTTQSLSLTAGQWVATEFDVSYMEVCIKCILVSAGTLYPSVGAGKRSSDGKLALYSDTAKGYNAGLYITLQYTKV